jgi:hypothetical protein
MPLAGVVFAAAAGCLLGVFPSGAATPNHCGNCSEGSPIGQIVTRIVAVGRPTLCEISQLSPTNEGGTSTVEIFSYSTTNQCDPASTTGQGVLYLVENPTTAITKYLLSLGSVTSSFVVGWQSGRVAIMLGAGTSILHQLEMFRALERHARLAFNRNGY